MKADCLCVIERKYCESKQEWLSFCPSFLLFLLGPRPTLAGLRVRDGLLVERINDLVGLAFDVRSLQRIVYLPRIPYACPPRTRITCQQHDLGGGDTLFWDASEPLHNFARSGVDKQINF